MSLRSVTAVLLLSLWFSARAQTPPPAYVFVTVDAVAVEIGRLGITGIKEGEASPSREYLYFTGDAALDAGALESCNRMALLAMTRPGQFLYTIDLTGYYYTYNCKLTKVNP